MLNSSFEVYHTCLFTFITEILTWLELLQRIILINATVLGETWQNLTATFPVHPRDWQMPPILLGISTSSQQDGPFKTKPKHTKFIIYFINKQKTWFCCCFPTLVSFRFQLESFIRIRLRDHSGNITISTTKAQSQTGHVVPPPRSYEKASIVGYVFSAKAGIKLIITKKLQTLIVWFNTV